MTDDTINPRVEETDAIWRIAETSDGRLLHRYLRRILESCRATDDHGALQRHEGARILARDLMGHMAPGIEGTLGRSDTSILPAGGSPVGARRNASRRRVAPDPAVTAFLNAADST